MKLNPETREKAAHREDDELDRGAGIAYAAEAILRAIGGVR